MKKQLFKALAATAIVGAVMAMSSVVAGAAVTTGELKTITDKASVNFGGEDTFKEGATNNGKIFNDSFEVVDSSSKARITSGKKEIGSLSFTNRYQLNGTTNISKNQCAIKFTVSGPATIQVSAVTGSNSATDRSVVIFDSEGNELASKLLGAEDVLKEDGTPELDDKGEPKKNGIIDTLTYTTEDAGTFYIGDKKGAVNIYTISVKVGGKEEGTNSMVIYDGTDAYELVAVTADEAETLSKVGVGLSKAGKVTLIDEAVDTVYETVTFDNMVFKGSDIKEGAEYIYAVKLTGSAADRFATHSATPARYEE